MKSDEVVFPALRCQMGDWIYYITYLSFREVADRVSPVDQVYRRRQLSGWIQRSLVEEHADRIATYLQTMEQRFFSALVIGVYGGEPRWYAFDVAPREGLSGPNLSEDDARSLGRSVGFLHFRGGERLFAIDGQHRVAGIKRAIEKRETLGAEEVCAIFVGHSVSNRARTRRLFVTLNKMARRVSPRDLIALDEDNGFAITTRSLVDESDLLVPGKTVAMNDGPALREDQPEITSIVNLFQVIMDLHPLRQSHPKAEAIRKGVDDKVRSELVDDHLAYWKLLADLVPEYKAVFRGRKSARLYRRRGRNHLLFRPIGQRAFASAVQVLVARKTSWSEAVRKLLVNNLWLDSAEWHHLLWDPVTERMITDSKNRRLATTFLLRQAGENAKTRDAGNALDEFEERRRQSLV